MILFRNLYWNSLVLESRVTLLGRRYIFCQGRWTVGDVSSYLRFDVGGDSSLLIGFQYSTLEVKGKGASWEILLLTIAFCNCPFKWFFHSCGMESKTLIRRKYSEAVRFLFFSVFHVCNLPSLDRTSHNFVMPFLIILFLNNGFLPTQMKRLFQMISFRTSDVLWSA